MKNSKQYFLLFGASVCVGVIAYLYFTQRRRKKIDNGLGVNATPSSEKIQPVEETIVEPVDGGLQHAPKANDCSLDHYSNDVSPTSSMRSPSAKSDDARTMSLSGSGMDSSSLVFVDDNSPVNGSRRPLSNSTESTLGKSFSTDSSKVVLKEGSGEVVSPMQIAETLMRLSKPGSLSELSMEDARVLKYTMSFVQGRELARILEIIAQAACFNVNLPVLSASGCLQGTQVLLKKAAQDRRVCPESVKISLLHALTNLSASDEHQQALKTSVDDLFSLSEGQEESGVGVACLCVIANLSLTKYCHPEIGAFSSRLFDLLEDEDTALLKQVLTILLNLCCEKSTVPLLLTAKAPAEMETFVAQTGPIGTNTDLLIKWLRILRNLYKVMREENITLETLGLSLKEASDGCVFYELQRLRLHMKACVFLLCHNKESHGLAAGAKMLYEYLEVIE